MARGGWRPGWAWTVRFPKILAVGSTVGGVLFGVAVSAFGTLEPGGLTSDQHRRLEWLMGSALGLAVVVFAACSAARWGRMRMLRRNGTAYIVLERADEFVRDQPDDFGAQVRRRFSAVIDVPGPARLGRAWGWPLDVGARQWDGKVSELVRSFRTLYISAHISAAESISGVFITAWWAVALAFGHRVQSGDRSLELEVWQRSSNGRAGKVRAGTWSQGGHRFAGLAVPMPAGVERLERDWRAELTVEHLATGPAGGATPRGNRAFASGNAVSGNAEVSVLLLRFSRAPWGPLPAVGAEPPDLEPLPVTVQDVAGVIPVKATASVRLHELRCTPAGQQFAWDDFPFLVATAVDWIQRKTTELGGHTLLLGAIIPNEVALGIGLTAGREDCLGWPEQLWPIMYRKSANSLVVPYLDLGTAGSAG